MQALCQQGFHKTFLPKGIGQALSTALRVWGCKPLLRREQVPCVCTSGKPYTRPDFSRRVLGQSPSSMSRNSGSFSYLAKISLVRLLSSITNSTSRLSILSSRSSVSLVSPAYTGCSSASGTAFPAGGQRREGQRRGWRSRRHSSCLRLGLSICAGN